MDKNTLIERLQLLQKELQACQDNYKLLFGRFHECQHWLKDIETNEALQKEQELLNEQDNNTEEE